MYLAKNLDDEFYESKPWEFNQAEWWKKFLAILVLREHPIFRLPVDLTCNGLQQQK